MSLKGPYRLGYQITLTPYVSIDTGKYDNIHFCILEDVIPLLNKLINKIHAKLTSHFYIHFVC